MASAQSPSPAASTSSLSPTRFAVVGLTIAAIVTFGCLASTRSAASNTTVPDAKGRPEPLGMSMWLPPLNLGTNCGGSNSCGSWFSHMDCKGTCCHDNFNAWCCPTSDASAWKCKSSFQHDSNHCDAPLSCTCVKNDYKIIRIDVIGNPIVRSVQPQDFSVCCAAKQSGCGVTNSVTWTQTQTLSWSDSVTESVSMDVTLDIAKFGISLSGTYTNGGSTTRTVSSTVTVPCHSGSSGYNTETFVDLKSDAVEYTIPVKMTAMHCGAEVTLAGHAQATSLKGNWNCRVKACRRGCSKSGCSAEL